MIWQLASVFNKRVTSLLSIARAEANLNSFRRIKKPSSKILEKQQKIESKSGTLPPVAGLKLTWMQQ